jgi:hypothetical protein
MRKNPRSPWGRGGLGEVIERLFVTFISLIADMCNILQYLYYIIKVLIPMYKHTKSRMSTGCA